jgi:hypothetical protein
MYSAVERSSLHITFVRVPHEQLRPLRKQWNFKAREKFSFVKSIKDTLPRSIDEVVPTTLQLIDDAQRLIRSGLVGLGPSIITSLLPSQAYDVVMHNIAKNRFDIANDDRVILDSSEVVLESLNVDTTITAIRRELQSALPNLPKKTFQTAMDPIFQALNVTRHTQAAFQYLMTIFQDSLQIWCRPILSYEQLIRLCPNAMNDSKMKVLDVNIAEDNSNVFVQSKIPFEILLRDWCYPQNSPQKQNADNGWVFLLGVVAVVTEGISLDSEGTEQNICVRLKALE